LKRVGDGSSYLLHVAREPKQNTSVWLALRNPAFFGLWLPSVVSGVCVSAHDTAATWLMNSLGASPLLLALIATAASLPFFVFTLPAGALADLSDRKNLLIAVYLWLAAAAGLLAVCTWLHWVHPYVILTTVFLLGIGFAFNAPVWGSIVPEIVQKEELASAITLGGVQMNLGGILGPALGGLLLPIMGPAMLFSLNALAFLTMAWVISQRYRRRRRPEPHLENFLESFASAVRYVRYTPGMQVILTRNFVCSLFIAAVPALVPVVALQHLRLQASHLGLVFTSMGIGSLLCATLILPYARAKASPNMLTILAGVMLVVVLVLMSIVPNLWMFLPVTALAGISWTVKASELWIAGQRAMPDWARGRMNAVNLMASQGAVALGGVLWGGAATYVGLGPTLVGGALLLTASLTLAIPLSINFASSLNLDPAPLKTTSLMIGSTHEFSFTPEPDDGPVTVTRDLIIRPEDREEFLALVKEYRLIFLRNGAFLFRVAENLEHPGTFRTEMLVSSWAEHLRQFARMTKAETELVERVWAMHAGDEDMVVGHYLPANRLWTPVDFGQFQKQPDARFTQATRLSGATGGKLQ
jgi:MFS family permease